jgi:hypothetical protein
MSSEGTGEPPPINDPRSPSVAGVGMAVVASPNKTFISSRRTPLVSGYKKYTVGQHVSKEETKEEREHEDQGGIHTDDETASAEESMK